MKGFLPATTSAAADENFDTRASICKLDPRNVERIRTAPASAPRCTYAGSGGSILGIYEDARMLEWPRSAFDRVACRLIVPIVATQHYASSR